MLFHECKEIFVHFIRSFSRVHTFIIGLPVLIDCEIFSLGFRLVAVDSVDVAVASPFAFAEFGDDVLLLAVAELLLLLFVLLFPFVSARRGI